MAELIEISWMTGVMHISQERRVEGSSIVYGYRINGGDFTPTMRMECHDKRGLDEATAIMASLGAPVTKGSP